MSNKIVVGVDEAGYGPNLGPLIIAASVWQVPEAMSEDELIDGFRSTFLPKPWKPGCEHVPLGDSKQLFQPGSGLTSLELGLLALLRCCNAHPPQVAQLLSEVGATPDSLAPSTNGPQSAPWYYALDRLPVPESTECLREIERLSGMAASRSAALGVQLLGLKAVVVSESRFNAHLERLGSKGLLLSQCTLRLVGEILADQPTSVSVFCDRQGGRKNYLPVLLDALPDEWFVELGISDLRSSYRNQSEPMREVHFSVGGDRFPPTGLASMLAKYVRERLMQSFNRYWQEQVPQIQPTAGYPLDAQRFRREIEAAAIEMGLEPDTWWRRK